jgi:polysaccharide chain length determinant protein (PEP-CTERM system associated)
MPDVHEDPSPEKTDWKKQWQVLRRRRWFLALPAFCVWIVVWAAAWMMPAVYRSETVILVEQQKVPEQYVVPNVTADMQDRLQSMSQQILGRTRLLSIVKDFNLYPKLRARVTDDELVERMRKDIQVELVQAPNRSGNLTAFKVAYLSNTPALAQKVTAQLTSLFINENLKARQEQSAGTTEFLAAQLEEAGRRLAELEAKIKEFKSQYLGQLPEQVQSNVQILAGLQSQLQQETDLLGKAKQQSVYLETLRTQWRSLAETVGSAATAGTVTPSVLDQELARLRAQLADLSSHYTDRHPDIRKLKDQIAKIERMKQQMEAQLAATHGNGASEAVPHPSNPVEMQALSSRMQMESEIQSNKVEIENRERAIRELQNQIGEYQARLNMTPVREQLLAGLTRDYEQSRKNYEQLLAKRDQSGMATDLEKRQEGEQFRVLDPPNLPQKPFSPNRLTLDLIGLVVGLIIGIVVLAGADIADDRIYSKDELATIVSAPILTEVPPLLTALEESKQIRSEWAQRGALSVIAVLVALGFASTYLFG